MGQDHQGSWLRCDRLCLPRRRAQAQPRAFLGDEEGVRRQVRRDLRGHGLAGSPAAVAARLEEERSGGSEDLIEGLTDPALTPVIVAVDGRPAAVAGFGDPLRPSARALVERIRRAGWRVGILSGDHPRVVAAVARRLGLDGEDCRGGVTPAGMESMMQRPSPPRRPASPSRGEPRRRSRRRTSSSRAAGSRGLPISWRDPGAPSASSAATCSSPSPITWWVREAPRRASSILCSRRC
ncbi:MAG: HAD family hydrolase [Planctomycetota bacterium]